MDDVEAKWAEQADTVTVLSSSNRAFRLPEQIFHTDSFAVFEQRLYGHARFSRVWCMAANAGLNQAHHKQT